MHDLRTILEQWGIPARTLYHWLDTDRGPIFCLRAPAARCADLWHDLRALVAETGHYPVLLGGDGDLEYHRAKMAEWPEQSTTAILDQAAALDPVAWLAAQREDVEYLPPDHEPWPAEQAPRRTLFAGWLHWVESPGPELHMGLLPVRHGWEALALLRFGWLEDRPRLIDHIALQRSWHAQFGAEVAAIHPDALECWVQRPAEDRVSALRLAEEHYAYCFDEVDQIVGSLERLAAMLLHSNVWHFWWD